MGAEPRTVPLDRGLDRSTSTRCSARSIPSTRIVYIANPNNPTGLLAPHAALRNFIEQLPPHVLCVLDEAYAEYAEGDDEPEGAQLCAKACREPRGAAHFQQGLRPRRAAHRLRARLARGRSARSTRCAASSTSTRWPRRRRWPRCRTRHEIARRVEHVKRRAHADLQMAGAGRPQAAGLARELRVCGSRRRRSGRTSSSELLRLGVAVRELGGFGAPGAFRVTCGNDEENQYFAAAIDRDRHRLAHRG